MGFVNFAGAGVSPAVASFPSTVTDVTFSADQNEVQFIAKVHIDGGLTGRTFGTSSTIGWMPGASITFAANSTLTVGVKDASKIDTGTGPAARATIGKAAFNVYKDLVGGTDTISSTTWREDVMDTGTPFTVNDGDSLVVSFLLATTSGSPSIKLRCLNIGTSVYFPTSTLVTAGPTYTNQVVGSNLIIKFDDGTLGWLDGATIFTVMDALSATIGNGNIFGNIYRLPFRHQINFMQASVSTGVGSNFALQLWERPLGVSPNPLLTVDFDQNATSVTGGSGRPTQCSFAPITLEANTDYLIGVKQTTANAVTILQRDAPNMSYLKNTVLGAEFYGATSTAGATFAAVISGNRRYSVGFRVSAIDIGTIFQNRMIGNIG